MQKSRTYGLSLPTQIFEKIDFARGDISRSRFILRLLEKGLDLDLDQDKSKKNVSGCAASSDLKHFDSEDVDDNPGGGELSINE